MAKCEQKSVIVEKITSYHLELTEEEAKVLTWVLAKVGGEHNTKRPVCDSILEALQSVDLNWENIIPEFERQGHSTISSGYITFLKKEEI